MEQAPSTLQRPAQLGSKLALRFGPFQGTLRSSRSWGSRTPPKSQGSRENPNRCCHCQLFRKSRNEVTAGISSRAYSQPQPWGVSLQELEPPPLPLCATSLHKQRFPAPGQCSRSAAARVGICGVDLPSSRLRHASCFLPRRTFLRAEATTQYTGPFLACFSETCSCRSLRHCCLVWRPMSRRTTRPQSLLQLAVLQHCIHSNILFAALFSSNEDHHDACKRFSSILSQFMSKHHRTPKCRVNSTCSPEGSCLNSVYSVPSFRASEPRASLQCWLRATKLAEEEGQKRDVALIARARIALMHTLKLKHTMTAVS